MRIRDLPPEEQDVIRSCLRFVMDSDALEGEFQTRMGVDESAVQSLLGTWPEVEDVANGSAAALAISNALNEVSHGCVARDWDRWFAVSPERVKAIYVAWNRGRGWTATETR